MSIAELQLDIIERIVNTQDTKVLEYVSALLHNTVNPDRESHWDTLSESERQRMIKSAEDVHNGEGENIPHEVVMEKYRKWL